MIKQVATKAPLTFVIIIAISGIIVWAILKTHIGIIRDENEALTSSKSSLKTDNDEYREENKRLSVENKELNQRVGNADFRLTVSAVCYGPVTGNSNRTSLVMMTRIINSGAPSIAVNWKLKLRLPNGSIFDGFMYTPAAKTKCLDQELATESLASTSASKRIELTEYGALGFVIYTNISKDEFRSSTGILSVEDARGKSFTNEQNFSQLLYQ